MKEQSFQTNKDNQFADQHPHMLKSIYINEQEHQTQSGSGRWSDQQHRTFLQGLMKIGKNWKELEKLVITRTSSQVRSHAQKYFLKLNKILKERKKNRPKLHEGPNQLELEILEILKESDITQKSPKEIVQIIERIQSIPNQGERPHFNNEKNLQDVMRLQSSKFVHRHKKLNSSKSQLPPLNFLLNYEEQEDQSFLIFIMKNHKHQFGKFQITNYVDFGNQPNTENASLEINETKNDALKGERQVKVGTTKKFIAFFKFQNERVVTEEQERIS